MDAVHTAPSVVVLGLRTDLVELILEEFTQRGVPATHVDVDNKSADMPQLAPNGSMLVVVDRELAGSMFDPRRTWFARRRGRNWERRICDIAFDVLDGAGEHRLLVLCDGRELAAHERSPVIRWVRQLALRIGYECSINGLQRVSTMYEVVAGKDDVRRTATSIAHWHSKPLCETTTSTGPTNQ